MTYVDVSSKVPVGVPMGAYPRVLFLAPQERDQLAWNNIDTGKNTRGYTRRVYPTGYFSWRLKEKPPVSMENLTEKKYPAGYTPWVYPAGYFQHLYHLW